MSRSQDRDINISIGASSDELEQGLQRSRKQIQDFIRTINQNLKSLGQEGMTTKQAKVFESLQTPMRDIGTQLKTFKQLSQDVFKDFAHGMNEPVGEKQIASLQKLHKILADVQARISETTAQIIKLGAQVFGIDMKSIGEKFAPLIPTKEQLATLKTPVVAPWSVPVAGLQFTQQGRINVTATADSFKNAKLHLDNLKQSYKDCKNGMGEFVNVSKDVRNGIKPLIAGDIGRVEQNLQGMGRGFRGLSGGIKGVAKDIEQLMMWQLRWYGARSVLFFLTGLPVAFEKAGAQFAMEIDNWKSQLLRWESTSGKEFEKTRAASEKSINGIILSIRKAAIELPIDFKSISESIEGVVGAGVPLKVVEQLVPMLAKLKAAFPDIEMKTFGVAITGAWNAFKDSMKGAETDVEKFTTIIEQLIRAQARGVIRPEQFTVAIQHLAEMSRLAGFTTEEMLAMTVVITDMGSRTGNAARSLRGMMEQIVKPATLSKLRELNIEFDKSQSLAAQLFHTFQKGGKDVPAILVQLRNMIGAGGGKSMEAMSLVSSIFPVERAKSATAMIDYLDKYLKLVQDIKNAQGGVDAAAAVMTERVAGQIQILQNRYKELALSLSVSSGLVKDFIVMANDFLLGALISVGDTAVVAGHKFETLGTAGKIAYDIFNGVATTLRAVKTAIDLLSNSFTIFNTFLKTTTEGTKALKEGTDLFHTVLQKVFQLITTIGLLLIFNFGKGILGLATGMGFATGMASKLSVVLGSLFALIRANWPVFAALLALQGIQLAIEHGTEEKKKATGVADTEQAILNIEKEMGSYNKDQLQATAEQLGLLKNQLNLEERINEVTNEREYKLPFSPEMIKRYKEVSGKNKNVAEFTWISATSGEGKRLKTIVTDAQKSVDNVLAQIKGQIAQVDVDEAMKKTTEAMKKITGKIPDIDKSGLRSYTKELRNARRGLSIALQEESLDQKLAIRDLESNHRLGLVGEKEYSDQMLVYEKEMWVKKLALIDEYQAKITKGGKIYNTYQIAIGKSESQNRHQEAKDLREELKIEQENVEKERKKALYEQALVRIKANEGLVRDEIKTRKILAEQEQIRVQESVERANWEAIEKQKAREWQYQRGLILSNEYYAVEEEAAKIALEGTKRNIDAEYSKWLEMNIHRVEDDASFGEEHTRELEKRFKSQQKAEETYTTAFVERERKKLDDIKHLWETQGLKGVVIKVTRDLENQFGNMGANLEKMMKDVAQAMNQAFEDSF